MIKQTKRKITILLYVIFMTAFFTVLFTFYTAQRESNKLSIERQLSHYAKKIKTNSAYWKKGDKPEIIESVSEEDSSQLSEIYTVRKNEQGELTVLKTENTVELSEKEILEIAKNILKQESWRGSFEHFQYKISRLSIDRKDILIIFTDISFFENQKKQLVFFLCIISIITIIAWAVISVGISGWLVKPLEAALEKQNEFISAAGHELKTPLSIMKASLEMLKTQLDRNKYLDYIIAENEKMDELVQEMLSLSRLEFQQEFVKLDRINLSKCIEGSALPFEVMAYERGICLEMQIEKDIFICGEEKSIQELTDILLDNAIRHTNSKGKTVIILEKKKEKVIFIVKNQGKEIPEEERKKIFEEFYRSDKARSRGEGRYGLGLSIARNIVKRYRTKIQVECESGWTSFLVKFEIAKNNNCHMK